MGENRKPKDRGAPFPQERNRPPRAYTKKNGFWLEKTRRPKDKAKTLEGRRVLARGKWGRIDDYCGKGKVEGWGEDDWTHEPKNSSKKRGKKNADQRESKKSERQRGRKAGGK